MATFTITCTRKAYTRLFLRRQYKCHGGVNKRLCIHHNTTRTCCQGSTTSAALILVSFYDATFRKHGWDDAMLHLHSAAVSACRGSVTLGTFPTVVRFRGPEVKLDNSTQLFSIPPNNEISAACYLNCQTTNENRKRLRRMWRTCPIVTPPQTLSLYDLKSCKQRCDGMLWWCCICIWILTFNKSTNKNQGWLSHNNRSKHPHTPIITAVRQNQIIFCITA